MITALPEVCCSVFVMTADGEIDRLKSDFIAVFLHELKTPLTSMKVFAVCFEKGKWLTGVPRCWDLL
jgi:signal transduction histidine kinase